MFQSIKRFFGYGASEGTETYLLSDPRVRRALGLDDDRRSTAGVVVNARTALTCSAWWRGLDLLSDAIAKIPYGVYRNLGDDKGKVIDRQHPWHHALSRKPGDYWTAFQFRKLMAFNVAHRGNAYAYIDRDNYRLTPISPDDITPVGTDAGIRYHHAPTGKFYNPDEILHYKGMGFDGLVGYGVIECAAESLGLSLAARRFQAKSFKNSARPSVILQFPRKMPDEQKKKIKEDWERMLQGVDNAKSTIVIDGEMEVKDFAFSAAEIQLMETQRFSVVDIANFIGVPAHKLGSKDGEGYNSLEQENLGWHGDKLEAVYVNFEQEDEDKLLTEEEKRAGSHEIAFDRTTAAFASADLAAKSNYLRTALGGSPWMQQSEARRLDGLNHVEGTDFIPAPANMGGKNNEPKDPASDPPRRAREQRTKTASILSGAADTDDDGAALRAATAAALESSCRRIVRRLGSQAKAATKRGDLAPFVATLKTQNLAAVSSELEHVEVAAGLAHGVDLGGKIAGQILGHLVHRLMHVTTVDCVEAAIIAACETVSFSAAQPREDNGRFGETPDETKESDQKFSNDLEAAMQKPAKIGPRGFPVVEVNGKEYMLKQGSRYSESEAMGAQYAKDAGVDVIEVRTATVQGNKVNAVAYLGKIDEKTHVDATGHTHMGNMTEQEKASAMQKVDRQSVERHTLYNYVIGHTDPNDANFLIKNNKIVGIDKDPSFRDGKGKSTEFKRPEMLRHLGDRDFAFSKSEIERMATAADKIADKLTAAGKDKDASGVRQRGAALRELVNMHGDKPTLGQLEDLGAGLQHSKSWISRFLGGFSDETRVAFGG